MRQGWPRASVRLSLGTLQRSILRGLVPAYRATSASVASASSICLLLSMSKVTSAALATPSLSTSHGYRDVAPACRSSAAAAAPAIGRLGQ
eukprot:18361-Pyramimonas_sp.AAC.1